MLNRRSFFPLVLGGVAVPLTSKAATEEPTLKVVPTVLGANHLNSDRVKAVYDGDERLAWVLATDIEDGWAVLCNPTFSHACNRYTWSHSFLKSKNLRIEYMTDAEWADYQKEMEG